jgi:hypothetical protein
MYNMLFINRFYSWSVFDIGHHVQFCSVFLIIDNAIQILSRI